ASQ
ncbi:hypothetical protein D030_5481B, partial [Vibrio parahaemolyticus AQ3810]